MTIRLDHRGGEKGVVEQTVCDVHAALFATLGTADTVISLNYDVVADYALQHLVQGQRNLDVVSVLLHKYDMLAMDGTTWRGGAPAAVPVG